MLEVSVQLQINYGHKGENLFSSDVQMRHATQRSMKGTTVHRYHCHNVLLLVSNSDPSISMMLKEPNIVHSDYFPFTL